MPAFRTDRLLLVRNRQPPQHQTDRRKLVQPPEASHRQEVHRTNHLPLERRQESPHRKDRQMLVQPLEESRQREVHQTDHLPQERRQEPPDRTDPQQALRSSVVSQQSAVLRTGHQLEPLVPRKPEPLAPQSQEAPQTDRRRARLAFQLLVVLQTDHHSRGLPVSQSQVAPQTDRPLELQAARQTESPLLELDQVWQPAVHRTDHLRVSHRQVLPQSVRHRQLVAHRTNRRQVPLALPS